jgi:hypothetical protein
MVIGQHWMVYLGWNSPNSSSDDLLRPPMFLGTRKTNPRSGSGGIGQVERHGTDQLDAFRVGSSGHQVQRAFDSFNQIKVEQLEGEFSRFDFRKIQEVVQDCHQGVRARADGFGKLTFLRVKVACTAKWAKRNNFRHPKDGVALDSG